MGLTLNSRFFRKVAGIGFSCHYNIYSRKIHERHAWQHKYHDRCFHCEQEHRFSFFVWDLLWTADSSVRLLVLDSLATTTSTVERFTKDMHGSTSIMIGVFIANKNTEVFILLVALTLNSIIFPEVDGIGSPLQQIEGSSTNCQHSQPST